METADYLRSLPVNLAIRVMNEIPYETLNQMFRDYPDLAASYQKIYDWEINERAKPESPELSKYIQDYEMALINSLSDSNTYWRFHPPGLLSHEMTNAMELHDPNVGGRGIYSMEMLLHLWFGYVMRNQYSNLDGTIQPDKIMNILLADGYRRFGLIPGQSFRRGLLPQLLESHFEPNVNLQLPSEVQNRLFQTSEQLRGNLQPYHNQLATIPTNTFLEQALKFESQGYI